MKAARFIQNFSRNRFVLIALRGALAAVFIYAGSEKLVAPQNFSDSIASFAILPNSIVNLVALGLPPFEIIAGLAILAGVQRRPALLGIVVLAVIFMIALASTIIRDIPVDCGCFGTGKPSMHTAWVSLGRDIPILAAALWLRLVCSHVSPSSVMDADTRTSSPCERKGDY